MLSTEQQESFARLWTEAQPSVGQYIGSLVPDRAMAKDLLQSTSLALLRKFENYDPDRPFLPWALGVAKFEVLGHRRDAARSRLVFDSDFVDRYTATWAEVAPRVSDEASALRHCLEKLPERQREVIRLRYFEDLNAEEIGLRLRLTAVNVRTRLKRTRDALGRCVKERLRLESIEGEGGFA